MHWLGEEIASGTNDPRRRAHTIVWRTFDQQAARKHCFQMLGIACLWFTESEPKKCFVGSLAQAKVAVGVDIEKHYPSGADAPMYIVSKPGLHEPAGD